MAFDLTGVLRLDEKAQLDMLPAVIEFQIVLAGGPGKIVYVFRHVNVSGGRVGLHLGHSNATGAQFVIGRYGHLHPVGTEV